MSSILTALLALIGLGLAAVGWLGQAMERAMEVTPDE